MANACLTDYRVTGNKAKELYNAINVSNIKRLRLYELAKVLGIDYEHKQYSLRGEFVYAEWDEDNNMLSFATDTAWVACTEFFDDVREYFGGIDALQMSWIEIEEGCEVFNKHTENNFGWTEKYIVCASSEYFGDDIDGAMFDTLTDAVNWWCEFEDYDRGNKTDEEMCKIIDSRSYGNDDMYFAIYEIKEI